MKDVIYVIETPGVSSKDILIQIENMSENQGNIICINYDGQSIHLKTRENENGLMKKLERKLNIKLHIKK